MSFSQGRNRSQRKGPEKQKRILLVGDWVVEERWVTGVHRSATSSRTGQRQLRSLHGLCSTVQSLSSAGRIATVLHRISHGKLYKVLGVGLWRLDDDDALSAMLEANAGKGKTPYQISRCKERPVKCCKLFNLAKDLKAQADKAHEKQRDSKQPADSELECYDTTHVFRIYQQTGAKTELLERVDWQLPGNKSACIPGPKCLIALEKWVNEEGPPDAVVIKDVQKEVVTTELIKWMAEKWKKTARRQIPWYVSSKAWRPDWLNDLKKVNLRLLLIPEVAAKSAVESEELDLDCWITRVGEPSQGAMREMDDLGTRFKSLIVVLPEDLNLLAHDYSKRRGKNQGVKGQVKDNGIVYREPRRPPFVGLLPMASVFFPAFIARDLAHDHPSDRALDQSLRQSLAYTRKWMKDVYSHLEHPENPKTGDELVFDPEKNYETQEEDRLPGKWDKKVVWPEVRKKWKAALSVNGIVESNADPRIELRRSMTTLDGYVCCVDSKRNTLHQLANQINGFLHQQKAARQHRSYMLIAEPGTGKSYLVKCLANALRLHPLQFNITQMLSKHDILDCFDTIVTTQAQQKDTPVLAFFDEINGLVDGQHVYDAFLAPIGDSSYVRAGKAFHIEPCIWMFAGTNSPLTGNPDHDRQIKASDFVSRLTLSQPFSLAINPSNPDQVAELCLERVYVGVSLIKRFFPDVHRMSQDVLELFHCLPTSLSVRDLEHFVESFTEVQFGEVKRANIPTASLQRLNINAALWTTNSRLVDIES
jgi:hypothetical protein